jgi:hypothetical protein
MGSTSTRLLVQVRCRRKWALCFIAEPIPWKRLTRDAKYVIILQLVIVQLVIISCITYWYSVQLAPDSRLPRCFLAPTRGRSGRHHLDDRNASQGVIVRTLGALANHPNSGARTGSDPFFLPFSFLPFFPFVVVIRSTVAGTRCCRCADPRTDSLQRESSEAKPQLNSSRPQPPVVDLATGFFSLPMVP